MLLEKIIFLLNPLRGIYYLIIIEMAIKRENLKVHKPTIWIFIAVIILFMVITVILLKDSDKRHSRKFIPTKQSIESRDKELKK